MNVEIISIGFELLSGRTINTNAAFIAKKMTETGLTVKWGTVITDEKSHIIEAFRTAMKRSNIIIATGGLGPTNDDITKNIITGLMGGQLRFDNTVYNHVRQRFVARGLSMPDINKDQAMVPDNAEILINTVGTAPGLLFRRNSQLIFVLPGVPGEMEYLIEAEVLPRLRHSVTQPLPVCRCFKTTGIPESAVYEKLEPLIRQFPDVNVMFYPEYSGVEIKFTSFDENNMNLFESKAGKLIEEFIYSRNPDENLASVLGQLLIQKKLSIAVAESCTGGLLGHILTSVPGSSEYFNGGIISYSNEAKENLLDVQPELLVKVGAVSPEVARQMAKNIKQDFNSHIGVGITGIAGPGGGSPEKPVGLVFIGIAYHDQTESLKFQFGNNRKINKLRSAYSALNLVRQIIKIHY